MNKFEKKMLKLINEASPTGTSGQSLGINTGDAWPDGLYTKRGERRGVTPASLTRGMTQIDFPASDNIYGGKGSLNNLKRAERDKAMVYRYLSGPEEYASIMASELRDDTPPLAPKQRLYGIHGFHRKQEYTIPPETHNFHSTAETLIKPTTAPEGTKSGGIQNTPEPGSVSGGGKGYRQSQKGGQSIFAKNEKLWGKWEDHRIGGRIDSREWKGNKLVDLLPKGKK
ncbi:hypothetical protein H8D04_00135 [bacterium]|nr:hypothetical protein [bacterium]